MNDKYIADKSKNGVKIRKQTGVDHINIEKDGCGVTISMNDLFFIIHTLLEVIEIENG